MQAGGQELGHIIAIEGGIADIRFEHGLPMIASRLVTLSDPEITIEVASLPGHDIARGLVMNPTADLRLGLGVRDTGGPIEVPVGEAVLGRMFNRTRNHRRHTVHRAHDEGALSHQHPAVRASRGGVG